MSNVRYEYIDEYVCNELQRLRDMQEHHDYSSMRACIERIQDHCNKMEGGLGKRKQEVNKLHKGIKAHQEELKKATTAKARTKADRKLHKLLEEVKDPYDRY